MINENLEYYKNIEKDYDLDKLNPKGAELFDIANKYHFYWKRSKAIYLKILYKLAYLISLYLAKKRKYRRVKKEITLT